MTQFSLFGAEAAGPALDDLDGLLLAGGAVGALAGAARGCRSSSPTAGAPTRSPRASPSAESAAPTRSSTASGGFGVRTASRRRSSTHAARWTRGAEPGPAGRLPARRRRAAAVGHRRRAPRRRPGTCSPPPSPDDPIHRVAGAQLARLGVAAGVAGASAAGRAGGSPRPGGCGASSNCSGRRRPAARPTGRSPTAAGSSAELRRTGRVADVLYRPPTGDSMRPDE